MNAKHRKLIGLTGGIATGKTTVSNYLARQYQLDILDADVYAKAAVKLNSPILHRIFQRYGHQVKSTDGSLNRQVLGEIIFNCQSEKQWLEQQIHPYVRSCLTTAINRSSAGTLVVSIPLLFEAKMSDLVTEIWVVSCSYQQQIQRLVERNQLNRQQAIARIEAQAPLADKIRAADVVLDNSKTLDYLYQQVDQAIQLKLD